MWALIDHRRIAAGAAVPATLLLLRYRLLRGEPLPPQREVSGRRLPPPGSVARPADVGAGRLRARVAFAARGAAARQHVAGCGDPRVDPAANRSAATMAATAAEVVSMERAAAETPNSQAYLAPTINAFTAQLNTGVRQYNEMVTAAAQLVSCRQLRTSRRRVQQRYRQRTDRRHRSAAGVVAGVRRTRRHRACRVWRANVAGDRAELRAQRRHDGAGHPADDRLREVEHVEVVAPQRDAAVAHLEHAAHPELHSHRAEDQHVGAFGEH